jgi:hypothetical protein
LKSRVKLLGLKSTPFEKGFMTKHGLGRRHSPDQRDRAFLIARRLGPVGAPLPTRRTWRIASQALNQGSTGTCVGHAWNNFLRCAPIQTTAKSAPSPFDIYRKAIKDDEWSANDVEESAPEHELQFGTSVRAGAKAVTEYGRLKSYLWAWALQPALEFVLTEGPCVIGVNWYGSFNRPDSEGIIRITPTSRIEGGHALLWRGVDTRRGLARLSNSWGDDWGVSGDCFIPLRDLERLIHEDGECCTALEQKVKATRI